MSTSPHSGVVRFLEDARRAAGGTAGHLAEAVAPTLGYRPKDSTVRTWLRGERHVDGYVLLAMMIALRDRGLSLDRYAIEDVDLRPLHEQIEELRRLVVGLHQALNADRANRGLPPVELQIGA